MRLFGLKSKEGKLFNGLPYDLDLTDNQQVELFTNETYEKFSESKHAVYKKSYYIDFLEDRKDKALIQAKVRLKHGVKCNSVQDIEKKYDLLMSTLRELRSVEV